MSLALSIEHLHVGYGHGELLKDLTLSIAPGRSLALIGPSGCGKSTLLSTLAQLHRARAGKIRWLRGQTETNLRQERTSFVWQQLGLYPWKTVWENLTLPLRLRHASRARIDQKASEMLEEMELVGLEDAFPERLSGGQRQRLALGRALISSPEVLFLDEPFSALDPLLREKCQGLLRHLHRHYGFTMIFVTHEMSEALYLASQILVMNRQTGLASIRPNPVYGQTDRQSEQFYNRLRHLHQALRQSALS